MKSFPPVSIVLAVIWLAGSVVYGISVHTSKLLYSLTGSPVWSITFVVLGILNLLSLVGFWNMQRWGVILYYAITIVCLASGILFYVTNTELLVDSAQKAGVFAAENVSGLFIFTIAFLPFRKEFRKKSNQQVDGTRP